VLPTRIRHYTIFVLTLYRDMVDSVLESFAYHDMVGRILLVFCLFRIYADWAIALKAPAGPGRWFLVVVFIS
jgi:hypothetical protein